MLSNWTVLMKIASILGRAAGALALAVGMSAAVSAAPVTPTSFVVFGDDFSDQGNLFKTTALPPSTYYFAGRFTNGEGFIDYLGQTFGLNVTNSLAGGTNYAYGGAVSGPGVYPQPPFDIHVPTVYDQARTYLQKNRGRASSSATFVIFSGSGDATGFLLGAESDPLVALLLPAVVNTGTNNVAATVGQLAYAGAKHIVVLNIPNLALVPATQHLTGLNGLIGPTLAKSFSQSWNQSLYQKLSRFSSVVTIEDFYNIANLQLKLAPSLGITNVTDGCLAGYGFARTDRNSCSASSESTHAFVDQIHFTTIGFFAMAQGTACALGQQSLFGAQSNCVVTPSNQSRSAATANMVEIRAMIRSASRGTVRI